MYKPHRNLRILHIILAIRETSAPYNEHCLPWADKREITICTYFAADIKTPETITLYDGDGSLISFFRNLRLALRQKEYDVIHVHSPHLALLFLLAILFSRQTFRQRAIITVHDSYQNFKFRNRLMFLPVFAAFQRVVCCSRASYQSFPALYKKLSGDRLCYVQNGLDIDRVDRIAAQVHRSSLQKNSFTAIAISRLVDIKNPFNLLTAFQRAAGSASRLVYIGDGPLRPLLDAKRRETRVENQIEFTGLIPREKVFEYLHNADLFISTSRGEGLPVSVLEAMACRCPVILSDIQPHREIAEGVEFIPLIHPDDIEGVSREIKKFENMPAPERIAIGQKCRKIVEERFSLSAMQAAYEHVYAQITGDQAFSSLERQVFEEIKS